MTSSHSAAALRHGVFLAPFHQMHENPTLCLERDFELLELIDTLGYAEAWIGEHHSAGFETISSPELFIAAAAVRTKHLRLGTGVISLPYHNPLMVANRLIQLDHQTRGRLMFGAGPGLLASDALMLGIDPAVQRDRMAEALDVILRLMQGETVTEKTEWYTLEEAKVNFLPYSYPYPETVVASAVTPSGGRLAGKYDLGMLNEIAAENGRTMDVRGLRVVMPMHIADTREQARANVRYGIQQFVDYFNNNLPRIFVPEGVDVVDHFIDNKMAVIGTPDDAIAMIERLYDKQPFGCMLFQSNNWADWEQTKRSYELYARHVIPHFKGVNRTRYWSYEWITEHQKSLTEMRTSAAQAMFDKHEAEQKAKQAAAEVARPKTGKEAW